MEYEIVEQKNWASSLLTFDCESCFLSCVVPCHVYSKIMSTTRLEYTTRIILYIILYTGIQQMIYIKYRIDKSMCPALLVDNCIFSDSCENTYMLIGENAYSCRFVEGFCVYNKYQCIRNADTSIIYLLTTFVYLVLTYLHCSARKFMMNRKNIEPHCITDCCAVTCCVSCGLAQEYRELP
jgi:hypothetical protein